MPKKCIICGDEAQYSIKDTSDHYCHECAEEHFGDIGLLVKVEEQAKRLKKMIESAGSQIDDLNESIDEAKRKIDYAPQEIEEGLHKKKALSEED